MPTQSLIQAVKHNNIEHVRGLIKTATDHELNNALVESAQLGLVDCVRELIHVADAQYKDGAALRWAAGNGHVECLKQLIPVSTNRTHNTTALRWAVVYGQLECMHLLIPISDM